ncbi:MAG TPA: hypothetical protein VMM76_09315, partial [Pirellulaceae bacterium]|nr:hypothetical protein [Pirellulaceae bacterium]
NRADIMGDDRNSPTVNVLAGIGFVLLLAMAAYTACISIPANIQELRQAREQPAALAPGVPREVLRQS